jgi:hypothetical protein
VEETYKEYRELLLRNQVLNKIAPGSFEHKRLNARLLFLEMFQLTSKEIIEQTKLTFK